MRLAMQIKEARRMIQDLGLESRQAVEAELAHAQDRHSGLQDKWTRFLTELPVFGESSSSPMQE
jgi:hypothetical protein